jgi:hypothetical protein
VPAGTWKSHRGASQPKKKCGTSETLRIFSITVPLRAKTMRQFKLLQPGYSHRNKAHIGSFFCTAIDDLLKAIAGFRAWCIFERRLEPPRRFQVIACIRTHIFREGEYFVQ